MANPNGDPDENRPRIDPYSGKNLVTEYRLKRTIRDQLKAQGELIFIREDLNSNGSRKIIDELAEPYIKANGSDKKVDRQRLIQDHIDIRLFGLLFAVKGVTFKDIGPVQFSIGQSLNKVQDILIRNTRIVPTKGGAESGTFGEKTILKYSLIVFHGFLNQIPAKENILSESDVRKMMLAIWHGTNNLSTSSKFGQMSRFLLRVIYSDEMAYIGDLDKSIFLTKNENIEDLSQTSVDMDKLFSLLENNKEKIAEIQFAANANFISSLKNENYKSLNKWASEHGIKISDILL